MITQEQVENYTPNELTPKEWQFAKQHQYSLLAIIESSTTMNMSKTTFRRINTTGKGSRKSIAALKNIISHFESQT